MLQRSAGKQENELSEEDYYQMQHRMAQIRDAYEEEDSSSQGERGQTTEAVLNSTRHNPYGLHGMVDRNLLPANVEKSNFMQL